MKARVELLRAGVTESAHRIRAVIRHCDGSLVAHAGGEGGPVFLRSVAKPFQALPLVEDCVVPSMGITGEEMALCCGSHSGEPGHVEAARSILARAGLTEQALECGSHPPFHEPSARSLLREEGEPAPIHNNCSGKHAGMLALARHHGWPTTGYVHRDHPVQRRMLEEVRRWSGHADDMPLAVDGCGVVTFGLGMDEIAHAYARFAGAAADSDDPAAVVSAMVEHPWMVAGTGRLCTALMEVTAGRVFAKVGAEGVYCAGIPELSWGVAVKAEDGARRASEVALLSVLAQVGVLSREELAGLTAFARPAVHNTLGAKVGELVPRIGLRRG